MEFGFAKESNGGYGIKFGINDRKRGGFRVRDEQLTIGIRNIYTTRPSQRDPVRKQDDEAHLLLCMAKSGDQRKYVLSIAVRSDQPALTQTREHKNLICSHRGHASLVERLFGNWRFLDPKPDLMRKPAFPGQTVLGVNGENPPAVLQEICADEERKEVLSQWLRELTPMDVSDFEFPLDPNTGLVQLVILETNGRRTSAYSASYGSLRFWRLCWTKTQQAFTYLKKLITASTLRDSIFSLT